MDLRRSLLVALLVASVQACGNGPDAATSRTSSSTSTTSPAPSPSDPAADVSIDRKVDDARQILAHDKGLELGAITMVSADSVEWPDSSYGCPAFGASYTRGPFQGYRIMLEAKGQHYIYVGADDTDPRRCLFLD